ncbi:hypothetical protein [Streptomyces pseudogriseolus]|uniref:hypothetical protein n=1 Tax=Streptomyces pseudogriseolus TaxID=36817 RepID=UPI003FA21F69
MTHSLARPYVWGPCILLITPETHRDLLRLWAVHHLAHYVNVPPGWCLKERANLLYVLAGALGYTDYRYTAPDYGSQPPRPTGTDLDLIRLARQYTRDTNHVIPGTRLMPSNACPSTCATKMQRCFTRHAPRGWRSTAPLAVTT